MKFVFIAFLLGSVGCAAQSGTSLHYQTPGVCHFDYGTRYSVRYEDGDRAIVASACETTDVVLSERL